eukprot:1654499-Rhodomonas_salina.1
MGYMGGLGPSPGPATGRAMPPPPATMAGAEVPANNRAEKMLAGLYMSVSCRRADAGVHCKLLAWVPAAAWKAVIWLLRVVSRGVRLGCGCLDSAETRGVCACGGCAGAGQGAEHAAAIVHQRGRGPARFDATQPLRPHGHAAAVLVRSEPVNE